MRERSRRTAFVCICETRDSVTPEHLADLAQGQVLVVVEGDHELLALGQLGDRVGDPVLEVAHVQGLRGVGRAGVLDRVHQRDLVAARVRDAPELVQGHDRGVRDREQRVVQLIDRDPHLGGDLLVGRGPLQGVLELRVGPLDLAGPRAHAARHPVHRAQLVDDRALDAHDRVRLELDVAREVEALDRRDQTDEAVGDQVRLLDVRRQAGRGAAGDVLDQRRVGDDQPLAAARVPFVLVAPPEFAQLDRFDIRLQGRPPLISVVHWRLGAHASTGRLLAPSAAARAGTPMGLRSGPGWLRRRRCADAPTLPECRSACWRRSRGRAAPGSCAGPPPRRAGGWRSCGAARAASSPRPRAAGSTDEDGAGRRSSRAPAPSCSGTAPRGGCPCRPGPPGRVCRVPWRARAGPGVPAPGSSARPPAPARRRARSGSCGPCPRPAAARRRGRHRRPPATRAPRPAARTSRPARTSPGRAARAPRRRGSRPAGGPPRGR